MVERRKRVQEEKGNDETKANLVTQANTKMIKRWKWKIKTLTKKRSLLFWTYAFCVTWYASDLNRKWDISDRVFCLTRILARDGKREEKRWKGIKRKQIMISEIIQWMNGKSIRISIKFFESRIVLFG